LAGLVVPLMKQRGVLSEGSSLDQTWFERLVKVLQERSRTLLEIVDGAEPFMTDPVTVDPEADKKLLTEAIRPALIEFMRTLERVSVFERSEERRVGKGGGWGW